MTKETKMFFGILAAAGTAGYVGYLHSKLNNLSEMINTAVDDLSGKVEVNISEDMLDAAVQRAVDREVKYISNRISHEVSSEMRGQVKKSVDLYTSDIKASAAKEIERQVKNIDISDMEREVVARAKDAVADKFDRKLDNLLEEYNENLQNVKKIYGSIAKSIAKD